jgi:hypothetical protein
MPRYVTARELIIASNAMTGENVPVPPVPKKRKNEESLMQQEIVKWWAWKCRELNIPEYLLIAIPLQGHRTPKNGARMKAEGMRAGTLDMQLCVARGQWNSLWIENKTKEGVVSKDQHKMMGWLKQFGSHVVVCRTFKEATDEIESYLST